MDRRSFTKSLTILSIGAMLPMQQAQAKTYLSIEQAREILWGSEAMEQVEITLSKAQMKSIYKAAKTRVRNPSPLVWKTQTGGWFVVDQVIGKHENIDMAYALDKEGKVMGLEILTYRESYGHEVINPKWRAQFHGKGSDEFLKLDKQIKNISGATLSCRHITDGINRLTRTWEQVLRHLA